MTCYRDRVPMLETDVGTIKVVEEFTLLLNDGVVELA